MIDHQNGGRTRELIRQSTTGRVWFIQSHSSTKVFLRKKWKFKITVHFKHEMIGKHFTEMS